MAGMTFQVVRGPPKGESGARTEKENCSSQGNLQWVGLLPGPGPGPRTDAETRDNAATFH